MILQSRAALELCLAMMISFVCLWAAGWASRRSEAGRKRGKGPEIRGGRQKTGRSAAIWLLPVFIFLGMFRGWQARGLGERELGLSLDGQEAAAVGQAVKITWSGDWVVLVLSEVTGTAGELEFSLDRMQVYLDASEERDGDRLEDLAVGNWLTVQGECTMFQLARNPGEFDFSLYYRSMKLHYRMFAESWQVTDKKIWPVRDFLYRAGRWASARLSETAGADAGMFQALMLGDKSSLPEETRKLYQDNGIAHMLAISGLHLSLVSMAVYGLLRKLGAGYKTAGMLGGSVLAAFAVMAGASPSLLRALFMALCGFLAACLGRTYDLLSALSLAGLWLLWDSPYLACQAGVQLSFGALMGIGAVAPRLAALFQYGQAAEANCNKASGSEASKTGSRSETSGTGSRSEFSGTGGPVQGFYVSLGMQLATLPMVLFHFFQFPLYGIFLNLFTVPLMGIVVASGAASVFFSGLVSLQAGQFVIGAGRLILDWYEWCCRVSGQLPGSSLVLGRPEFWQIGAYYGILLAGLSGRPEKKKIRSPARNRGGRWLLLAFAILFLLPVPDSGLTVTFLDVGQGDGIVLQTRETAVLVDGGSSDQKKLGENRLEPFLKSQAVRQLDYAIVSHADQDHTSGLIYLLEESEAVEIRNLILPAAGQKDEAYEKLAKLAEARNCRVHWMEAGQQLILGKLNFRCLYPSSELQTDDRNEHSLVLHVSYGKFDMMLTGDMSLAGEADILQEPGRLPERPEVLKISHHGSHTATTEEWLDQLKPGCAVVSYGEENRYGHPHLEVMERLKRRRIPVLETGKGGAVIIKTDGVENSLKIRYNNGESGFRACADSHLTRNPSGR